MSKITVKFSAVKREASRPNKPMVGAGSLVAMHKGEMREVITVRTYMSAAASASVVQACVWCKPIKGDWHSGLGSAGGYGYHKESQAIADAVDSAGVELFGDPYMRDASKAKQPLHFGGTGSSYYEAIFKAIARAMGYRGRMAWITHSL